MSQENNNSSGSEHEDSSSDSKSGSSSSSDSESESNSSSSESEQSGESKSNHDDSKSTNDMQDETPQPVAATGVDGGVGAVMQQPSSHTELNAFTAQENNKDDSDSSESSSDSDEHINNNEQNTQTGDDVNYSAQSSPEDEEDLAVKRLKKKQQQAAARRNRTAASAAASSAPKRRKASRWKSETSEEDDGASNSDSDSDDRTRRRRKPPPNRRKKISSEDEGRTVSRRKTTAAVSYKEASEDEVTDSEDLVEVEYEEETTYGGEEEDKSETIERVVGKRIGRRGATGSQTTCYEVDEHGDPNTAGFDPKTEGETQYLIKWKNWSHIHNTYETEATLAEQKVKGIKKLENYIRREHDIEMWRKSATPEDIDYYECQQELQQELLKTYNSVDRIIAQNVKEDGNIDYLCKWESLPYMEATWEDAGLVQRKWPEKIAQFEAREQSKSTPSRHCKAVKYRPKFQKVETQPEFLGIDRGLVLRDYQMDGLNWLILTWCRENSVILADEMGLGKTIQTICFLYYLHNRHNVHGPFLCVVPLSTMTAWQREFQIWAPDMNVVTYLGDVSSREIIRQYEWCFANTNRLKFNAILTTYEILLKDKTFLGCISWAAVLVDEAHRLKNDDSLLYKALKEFETNYRLLITGTPLQNSLKELWALLHFIMPDKFETWDDFERNYGGKTEKQYAKLHKALEPYIIRRVKKDVEKSLPAKVEQILRVEMTSIQKQYYKWILTKNFNALRKGQKGCVSSFVNIVIELKKCCNHAFLTKPISDDGTENAGEEDSLTRILKGSGKLVLLDKLLCRLRETGHRVLIFSQMVRMLDILAEYLQKRHFPFQRLDGSIKGEIRKQALDHFNAEGSTDFCFLLSTRAGGLGINLATADTVIIFDSDWNPQNDLQAQARAHRIGQKNQVNIYRLVTARSVEEEIVERAKQKMVLDHLVIQRMDTTGKTVLDKNHSSTNPSQPFSKEELSAILKFGADELFKDDGADGDDELVCDIDDILRRAETRNEEPTMAGDELLSAFKVASFAFDEDKDVQGATIKEEADDADTKDWDDIIPENFRKAVELEERNKEMEDLYLPPRRKNQMQTNQTNELDEGLTIPASKLKGRKVKNDDNDSNFELSDASDEDRPKKRGRASQKEKIPNFTDTELRRFIRSLKKFPSPMKRLEAIACDAELQEKPLADLRKACEILLERCRNFLNEHSKDVEAKKAVANTGATAEGNKGRGAKPGFSIKFGGVSFNARTLMACVDELEPLDEIMPSALDERLKWTLEIKTRPANFDVEWGAEEDSKLLCGIYQHGMGSWDTMKVEPSLNLGDKVLLPDNKKPQAKHLQSRSEYLLKIIKKNLELKRGLGKQKKPRKPREKAAKSKPTVEPEDISSAGEEKRTRKERTKSENHETLEDTQNGPAKENDKKKTKHKPKKPKKNTGPMHFTANSDPTPLNVLGGLEPMVFNECKEKMRPVKKALKALDKPDGKLSEAEQVNHTRQCLLSIGNQINKCLADYTNPEKVKEWRSNLWYFVSNFTEFDAKKLFKLYKHALKKDQQDQNSDDSKSQTVDGKKGDKPKKDKKEKKKHKDKSRDEKVKKRKHNDGEYDENKEHKRMHVDSKRDRDDRKKYDEYKDRGNSRGALPPSSRVPSAYPGDIRDSRVDPRDPRDPNARGASAYSDSDRWSRERYDKRDRYDSYSRHSSGYHRERERDRDRRQIDKRSRYTTPSMPGYPPYMPGYYPSDSYRATDRYGAPAPHDWREREYERDYGDYRREYDRRPPASNT